MYDARPTIHQDTINPFVYQTFDIVPSAPPKPVKKNLVGLNFRKIGNDSPKMDKLKKAM